MRRLLFALSTLIAAALFVTPATWGDIASRLCPSSAGGCLVSDGTFLCLDSNRDGIPCGVGDPNLTINAPLGVTGDEQVQGDLDVAGDLNVVGTMPIKTVEALLISLAQQTDVVGGGVISAGFCLQGTGNNAQSCNNSNTFGSAIIQLDQQVFINQLICGWSKGGTTWDSGDTVTFKLTEANGTTSNTFGSGITVTDTSPAQATTIDTINANTSFTSDYALVLQTTAGAESTEGTEGIRLSCRVRFSYP